ncbi:response regulator [Flavobacterium sufflavum]|uniref:Response regulator n=1 Tax=Flavobacterium sufflavum TaxID=1921138 RepID=A0A3S2V7N9_9FLAO|nr:response regulator [Flavobacterium sufflavum]RVT79770.1 response regulator [Flavobacterium sufflavum]
MKKVKILLVDDDTTYLFITKKILEQQQNVEQINTFMNGLEALTYLKEHSKEENNLPNILFLDLFMPIMDGWEFLDEFKEVKSNHLNKITIYICTSSISPHDVERAKNISSVSGYIIKPISKIKLVDILNQYIN